MNRKKNQEPVVLDSSQQKNIKRLPKQAVREAALSADRNRWFIATLVLALIALVSVMSAYKANIRADNSIKAAWVKMYPNGTWDVEFHDANQEPEFFKSTIDYLLRQWVERRYSEIPHSIKNDYGYVYNFMSPGLRQAFVGPTPMSLTLANRLIIQAKRFSRPFMISRKFSVRPYRFSCFDKYFMKI